MGFIGKVPTPVPLTSSDITDGIISSAKIADGTITATDMDLSGTYAFTGTVSGAGESNTPYFKVKNSGNVSISDNTLTKLSADTEVFDSDSAFASDKFTVPSGEGGKYIFTGRVYMPTTTNTDYAQVTIYKNGSQISSSAHVHRDSQVHLHVSIESASAGDYFEIYFRHNIGSNQDSQLIEFSGFKVSS